MRQKIIQAGNSLMVVIPNKFVKSLGLKKGDSVKSQITISKGKITYSFSGAQQLSLAEDLNT